MIRRASSPPSTCSKARVPAGSDFRAGWFSSEPRPPGLLDIKTTPVDSAMPGVEINAQVLENMLTQSTLSAPSYAIVVELAAALLAGAVFIWLTPILGPLLLLVIGRG